MGQFKKRYVLEEKEHWELGGSGVKRWTNCFGARNAIKRAIEIGGKPKTSFYAAEGTVAHALLEERLQVWLDTSKFIMMGLVGIEIECDGHVITVDKEMIRYVEDAVSHIQKFVYDNNIPLSQCFTERSVKVNGHEQMGGSADFSAYNSTLIYTFDFKYGKGKKVDESDAEQLMFYNLGTMHTILPPELLDNIKHGFVDIYQPRHFSALENGPNIRIEIPKETLIGAFHEKLVRCAAETDKPDAPVVAGPWCEWCPAAIYTDKAGNVNECSARVSKRSEVALNAFAAVAKPLLPDVSRMTPEQVGLILSHKKDFAKWLESVEEVGQQLLSQGYDVPGQKLVKSFGDRVYKDDDVAEAVLEQVLGAKAYTVPKLVSPAQAEKLGVPKSVTEQLCTRPYKGITIAPMTDKREAVDPAKAFESVAKDKNLMLNDL